MSSFDPSHDADVHVMRVRPLHALIATVVLAMAIYYCVVVLPRGELGQKSSWGTLQGIEAAHRDDVDVDKPRVIENALGTSHTVLGLPTEDGNVPRAWLMLDESAADGSIFLLPKGASVRLQCSYVSQLATMQSIDAAVLKFLQGACTNSR